MATEQFILQLMAHGVGGGDAVLVCNACYDIANHTPFAIDEVRMVADLFSVFATTNPNAIEALTRTYFEQKHAFGDAGFHA